MPKDAYYFRHDANASSDFKLKAMRRKYGWKGMGWYWYIIECLRNEDEYFLNYSDFTFASLSEDMKCEPEEAKAFVDDCIQEYNLLTLNGEHFSSERLNRDMAAWEDKKQKQSMAGKASAKARGDKFLPASDNTTSKMIELYEQKIGKTLTPGDADLLKDIVDNYSIEQFESAVDEALSRNARSMKYIAKVLDNWGKDADAVSKATSKDDMEDMTEE